MFDSLEHSVIPKSTRIPSDFTDTLRTFPPFRIAWSLTGRKLCLASLPSKKLDNFGIIEYLCSYASYQRERKHALWVMERYVITNSGQSSLEVLHHPFRCPTPDPSVSETSLMLQPPLALLLLAITSSHTHIL